MASFRDRQMQRDREPVSPVWDQVVSSLSKRFRSKRAELLTAEFAKLNELKIIDVGGSLHFWQESELGVPAKNITIYNLEDAGDVHAVGVSTYADVTMKSYDGVRLPEADATFDLCICNSVIEHVPPPRRAALVRELRRVAKHVYLQTPAKTFPLEPHFLVPFLQWLPKRVGYEVAKISPWRVLSRPTAAVIQTYFWNTNLLTYAEVRQLLPDATIHRERLFGLTKSYAAITP